MSLAGVLRRSRATLLASGSEFNDDEELARRVTSLEVRDPRLTDVVGPDVTFEKVAGDCLFTEGPLWHPRSRYLLWSDMPGDHLRRWSASDGVTTFRKPCNKSNGLTWDRQGRLLACEHATSHVTVTLCLLYTSDAADE